MDSALLMVFAVNPSRWPFDLNVSISSVVMAS
jgi:hypothetical protein